MGNDQGRDERKRRESDLHILEGVFEVNSGNLRRAWVILSQGNDSRPVDGPSPLSHATTERIDPELMLSQSFMWFRIVYMDVISGLLLGLPQGTSDKSMGAMSVLQHEPP